MIGCGRPARPGRLGYWRQLPISEPRRALGREKHAEAYFDVSALCLRKPTPKILHALETGDRSRLQDERTHHVGGADQRSHTLE